MSQPTTQTPSTRKRNKWLTWLGAGLLVLSGLVYITFLFMPTLPLSAPAKVALGTAIVITGEISAWLGSLLVGATVVQRYKRFLNPRSWFSRPTNPPDSPT